MNVATVLEDKDSWVVRELSATGPQWSWFTFIGGPGSKFPHLSVLRGPILSMLWCLTIVPMVQTWVRCPARADRCADYCSNAIRHYSCAVSKLVGQWPKFTARSSVRPEVMVTAKGTESGQARVMRKTHPCSPAKKYIHVPAIDPMLHAPYSRVGRFCPF